LEVGGMGGEPTKGFSDQSAEKCSIQKARSGDDQSGGLRDGQGVGEGGVGHKK